MTYKINLKDVYKGYTLDQDKVISPEETVHRFRERLNKIDLNILEETVRIDNGRLDIPVYFSICGKDAQAVMNTRKQMGKGGTPEQAEASAVMELAERFSLFSFLNTPEHFVVDEYRNIKDEALPFESLALSVHDGSPDLDRAYQVFSEIPLRWCHAYSLTEEKDLLIPFDWFYTINQFNGSSAGNCAEETILQGVCEIVERHVSSLISGEQLLTPSIDLSSVTDPLALELIDKYRNAGIRLYVRDFSLDIGIPTVGILAYDPSTFPDESEIVWTAGTTPSPEKALVRALTEVAQLAGDFNTGSKYVASGLPKFNNLNEADYVINHIGKIDIKDLPDLSDNNMRVEIENCIKALSQHAMEVITIDVTHPVLQIPSFYSIVPGAHFRERAAGTCVGMVTAKLVAEGENPSEAISKLKKMNRTMPDKYYVKFFMGLSYLSTGNPSSALKCLEEALEHEPDQQDIPTIYSYMGVCLKEMECYEKAVSVLEEAEKYDAERTDIYNLMGFCYFKQRKHTKAIECFQRVLALDPGSAIDYANIASNYREMGKREEAIHFYKFALELDPSIDFARESLKSLESA